MQMRDDGKRKTVVPLPGKGDEMVTLRSILDWLGEPRTLAEFADKCGSLGYTSEGRVTFFRNFLKDIGCVVEEGNSLQAKGSFKTDESIIRPLHDKCKFVGQLLEEVSISSRTINGLVVAQKRLGLDVKKHEIGYRLNYLQSAGMLEVKGGKLHITDKGKRFLKSLDGQPMPDPYQPSRVPLNVILYGPPGTGKTYATFSRCVEICDGKAPADEDKVQSRYKELVKAERVEFVTFHQSYGYEEFVEGLRPDPDSEQLRLVPVDGVLKRIAERARKDSERPYVLVIDEINRANISKVLGELITLLEKDKREGNEVEVAVTLPHSGQRFTLPDNLHILGTMNTADRSIALIDTALRRRFEFEELPPDDKLLGTVDGINLQAVLRTINNRLEYLIDRDHLIGHAWLMKADTKAKIDNIMRRKIIPLIAEYFYDDWQKVQAVLGGTDHFVAGKALNPPPGLGDGEGHDKRWSWAIQKVFGEGAYESLVAGK